MEWFGTPTPAVTVPITEPAACAGIRLRISQGLRTIRELQRIREGLDPRIDREEIREINERIARTRAEVDRLRNQGEQFGCGALPASAHPELGAVFSLEAFMAEFLGRRATSTAAPTTRC